MRFIGIHLIQPSSEIACSVAILGADGALERLAAAPEDADVLESLPSSSSLIALDAPIFVPNAAGRRRAEDVLAWCDINVFPASRQRLERVYGGIRGERLADRLDESGHAVVETYPEVVLRQLVWEEHRGAKPPLDLARYREEWIGVKAPAFTGARGTPGSVPEMQRALELLGSPDAPDLRTPETIAALAAAYAARRSVTPELGATLELPLGGGRQIVLPGGPELLSRAAIHVERLSATRSTGS